MIPIAVCYSMKILEIIIIPIVIGVGTGLLSSYLVSRWFLKKGTLGECDRLLRRLCPYRKENVRAGDGLEETGWSLLIESEILAKHGFRKEAEAIRSLADTICSTLPLPDQADAATKAARDKLKEGWKKSVAALY
jgi:hypothetical protein